MNKSTCPIRFLKLLVPVLALLVAEATGANAQIVNPDNMINWVPSVTVGVRGGIPAPRTNGFVVTMPPFNADNTGKTSAAAAIQSAIKAASAGQVVYLPAGIYDIRSGVTIDKDNVTLRGDGTNTILVGKLIIGHDPNGNYPNGYGIGISSGAVKGATSMVLNSNVDLFSSSIGVGDAFWVTSLIYSAPPFQYISMNSEDYATTTRTLVQPVVVTNVSGNTITFTPPLVWDFTNSGLIKPMNLVAYTPFRMRTGIGLENFTLTTTNNGLNSSPTFMLQMEMCHDSWVTHCNFFYGENYNVYFEYCVNCTFAHNQIRYSKGGGSNHSGLLTANDSGCLIEDNIIADGLTPGFEWNDGFCGNAIFANYFTNNFASDMDCHNTHPVMNLWEENVCSSFELDGYFGSASHQTVFRERHFNTTAIKRWNTYIQVVGCVLGNSSYPYCYYPTDNNYPATQGYGIFELGYPNIGNANYDGVSGPVPWNYPGNHITGFFGENITNGVYTITSTQVNTNIIAGIFTNIPTSNYRQYPILGQDPVNTNVYHFIGFPASAPTPSKITLTASTTVSNGWKVFVTMQNAYQWLQTSNILTDTISGNAVYTNSITAPALVWDANGMQTIPTSLLYTSGAPNWWGANRWPAIDPLSSPAATTIPAENRYVNGVDSSMDQLLPPPKMLVPPFNLQTVPGK